MGEGDVGLAQGVVVVDSWGGVDEGDLVRVEGGDGGAAGDDAGVCGRELAEEGGEGAVDAGLPVDEGAVDVEGEGLEGGEGRGGGHDGCSGGAGWGLSGEGGDLVNNISGSICLLVCSEENVVASLPFICTVARSV